MTLLQPITTYLIFEIKIGELHTDLMLYQSSADQSTQSKELIAKEQSTFSLDRVDQLIINYWLSINGMDQQFFNSTTQLKEQLKVKARNCRSQIDQDHAFKSIVRQQINCQISIEDYERKLIPMINRLLIDCSNFLQFNRRKRKLSHVLINGEGADGRLIKKSFTAYFSCEVLFNQAIQKPKSK